MTILAIPSLDTELRLSMFVDLYFHLKKEYFILVIEILYSIPISFTPVLSLSHTLYPLFHILFPSLLLSLSPQHSLSRYSAFSVCTVVLWE